MLRTLFGRYSGLNLLFKKNTKIIDVGCGFGNNLIPFLNLGSKVYGVEIDKVICNITMKILKKNFPNKDIHIKVGHNRSIPFKSNFPIPIEDFTEPIRLLPASVIPRCKG